MPIDEKAFQAAVDTFNRHLADKSPKGVVRTTIEAYEAAKAVGSLQPVSLERCAMALCKADEAWDMNAYSKKKPHARGLELAKVVLEAAGVKYVD
jgi:hypothetical protein